MGCLTNNNKMFHPLIVVSEEWEEKFYLAAETVSDLLQAPELYDFWLLLEESRIAVFAPEMPLKIKSPVNKLENAWKELRF